MCCFVFVVQIVIWEAAGWILVCSRGWVLYPPVMIVDYGVSICLLASCVEFSWCCRVCLSIFSFVYAQSIQRKERR
jgi:hypothetical protein